MLRKGRLQVGSQCIFKVMTTTASFNYSDGTYVPTTSWVDKWIDCSVSRADYGYNEELYCNQNTGKCAAYKQTIPVVSEQMCYGTVPMS
jgi:hypothetical protein